MNRNASKNFIFAVLLAILIALVIQGVKDTFPKNPNAEMYDIISLTYQDLIFYPNAGYLEFNDGANYDTTTTIWTRYDMDTVKSGDIDYDFIVSGEWTANTWIYGDASYDVPTKGYVDDGIDENGFIHNWKQTTEGYLIILSETGEHIDTLNIIDK